MNPLLLEMIGSFVRAGLTVLAGYLISAGIWTPEDASKYVAAAALAIVGLGWSFYQKWTNRRKLVTALGTDTRMNETQLEAKISSGLAASVTTAKTVTPSIVP